MAISTEQTRQTLSATKPSMTFDEQLIAARKLYTEVGGSDNVTMLVTGYPKSGKTSLIKTCPKPVLVYSFDPRGTSVLNNEIAKGEVLAIPFWNEASQNPTEYRRFETFLDTHVASDFLNHFSFVVLDSYTFLQDCLTNATAVEMRGKTKGERHKNVPILGDYRVIQMVVEDIIRKLSSVGVNFMLTAHLSDERDEQSGEILRTDIDAYKNLKKVIPAMFPENYVVERISTVNGVECRLHTAPFKRFTASTHIGAGGVFSAVEEPNIRALLKKAGKPHEDKPLLPRGDK